MAYYTIMYYTITYYILTVLIVPEILSAIILNLDAKISELQKPTQVFNT